MAKLPAFQFYPGDWRKDVGVQSLDYFDRGVWHEMLCLMHESERRGALMLNGRPMPRAALARALGLPVQQLNESMERLIGAGVATVELPLNGQGEGVSEGVIVCRRMVRDEEKRQGQIEDGKRGGNPVLAGNYNTAGYVYAIQRQSDLKIKIGISINPTKRLYKLRYESKGDTLTLLATKYVDDMGVFEAELHRKYAEFASGEWFALPPFEQGEMLSTLKGQLKGKTPPSPSSSSSSSSSSSTAKTELPEGAKNAPSSADGRERREQRTENRPNHARPEPTANTGEVSETPASLFEPAVTTRESPEMAAALREVFAYYLTTMKRNPRTYSLSPLRRKKGMARLEEARRVAHGDLGGAVELMKAAIDEVALSDWHMGRNPRTEGKSYCEWEDHLFRSTEQFEKWVQRCQEAARKEAGHG